MHSIIHYKIAYNIVNIANQLFFVYYKIISKLRVFISLLIKIIKTSNFIHFLEKKQDVWATLAFSNQYLNFFC